MLLGHLLHGFEAGHKASPLLGVVGVACLVVVELLAQSLVVGEAAQAPHDEYAGEARKEVVVGEARGVVVEDEEEGHGHDAHHPLHHLHLLLLLGGHHGVLLLAHADERVDDVGEREQEAEDAHVVADEPEVLRPADEVVVGREVVGPEEALSPEFDGVGDEVEEGNPDGHLDEHGQAASHGRDTVLGVELHHLLLLLHGVFLLGVFGVDFVHLGLQHAHTGRGQVAFLRGGVDEGLHDEREQQEHDAHVEAEAREPVEEVEDEEAVDPLDDGPPEVHQVLQLEVLVGEAEAVGGLEGVEVVGAQVELHLGGLLARGVEGRLHLGLIHLQVAAVLLLRGAGEADVLEVLVADDDGREELVLEVNPVERLLDVLGDVLHLVELLRALVLYLVGEGGVAVLERAAFLLLLGHVVPREVDGRHRRGKEVAQALGLDGEVEHVGLGSQAIGEQEPARADGCREGERAVGLRGGLEVDALAEDVLVLRGQGVVEVALRLAQQHDVLALLVVVVTERGALHDTALRADAHAEELVLEHDGLGAALAGGKQHRRAVDDGLAGSLGRQGLLVELGLQLGFLHLGDAVLASHFLQLRLTGAAPPREAD